MRVALYARVSTDRQERDGTIGSQLEVLQQRAAAEGWQVALSCLDDGYSGTRLDRPGLDQVRDAAMLHAVDAVVVLCPDRLARNYVHQMIVLEELARFGVRVVFCEGRIADDPGGRLLVQIQAAVAEFEQTKIVERNRRGKLFRARQGAIVCGAVPFGYRKVPAAGGLPSRLAICEPEAVVVRQIFALHVRERLTVRQIGIRLIEAGVPTPRSGTYWSPSSLSHILRQPAYAGTFYYNRHAYLPRGAQTPKRTPGYRPLVQRRPASEWIGVAVPAIVDPETWTRSQALHAVNARFSPRHVGAERYLLRYLVRCGECGRARGAMATGVHRYYACRHPLPRRVRPQDQRCRQPASRVDELDLAVWDEVVRHLQHPDLIARASIDQPGSAVSADKELVNGQLTELRQQRRRLLDAYQAGAILLPALQARQQPLLDRIAELERQQVALGSRALSHADAAARITAFADQTADRLEAMTFAQRQQLLRTILEKVVVSGDRVELFFKIPLLPPAQPNGPSSPRRDDGRGLRSECLQAILVADQRIAEGADLEQAVPVGRAARQAADLKAEHDPDLAQPDRRHQALEARAIGVRAGLTEIAVDHHDLLEGPAQGDGALAQGILALRALGVLQHLAQRALADIQVRLSREMRGRDLLVGLGVHVHQLLPAARAISVKRATSSPRTRADGVAGSAST